MPIKAYPSTLNILYMALFIGYRANTIMNRIGLKQSSAFSDNWLWFMVYPYQTDSTNYQKSHVDYRVVHAGYRSS